jgi:hypothetical protein
MRHITNPNGMRDFRTPNFCASQGKFVHLTNPDSSAHEPIYTFGPTTVHSRCRNHCDTWRNVAALAPPLDSLNDDNDLPVSDVVDFTPFREVTIFEPNSKTWPNAIATRSISLLKPSHHGDKFSDNTTAHAAVTISVARQYTAASPHASHAVLWLGHRHYSNARLTLADYRR